ncbi:MAG: cytochrome c3 family protein [Bacteroidales bacterium]
MNKPSRIYCKACNRKILLLVILLISFSTAYNKDNPEDVLDPETQKCLDCHAGMRYTLTDPVTGDMASLKMYDELRIDPHLYIRSAHGSFACTDCHSPDYEIHPHPISVKFEFQYSCIDCHGGDEHFARFNFEKIEEEFNVSIHGDHYIEDFSCWSCHNPHTYRLTAREGGRIIDIVAHNNSICLECHGDISHYAVLIERQLTNMLSKHEWLPNQSLHFRKVRCIDCHAAVHEDILVAHHVLPASEAVRNCVECHSTNSILMASLYKHKTVERRSRFGFFNSEITTDAYIIGANRNYYFNLASIVILGLVLLGIAIHATLRYIHYRQRK